MAEPMDMSQARNAYAKEREHFRKDMLWSLRAYDGRPITFDIKQNLRFRSADLKQECLELYRTATRNIKNNQATLIGSNLRIRSLVSAEEVGHDRTSLNENRRRRQTELDLKYDEDDLETFYKHRGNLQTRTRDGDVSTPISKLTFQSHRTATTNTHVLSFERQLVEDMDRMIASIEGLDDSNRSTWLQVPRTDSSQYFASRYDNTGFSLLPINHALPSSRVVITCPGSENSPKTNDVMSRTSSEHFYQAFSKCSSLQ